MPELSTLYGKSSGTLQVSSIHELWAIQRRIYDFQVRYLAYWNSTAKITKSGRAVDAVILPATPTASYRPTQGMYFGYTGIWNLLDFSAVVVPVTKVQKHLDILPINFKKSSELDQKVWETCE